ncbi:hemerythrin domain-containing protein [Sphingomonas sp. GCM10030256]|uniref:hemerythrin domain-containing protein n=1 Tax=Sphingomonas sp. GCM10030256 TaxID=3273427 RepID=UPI00360CA5ED
MATRTDNRDRTRAADRNSSSSTRSNRSSGERSAFSWNGGNNTGPLLGALAAGAAIGIGANWARKFLMQQTEAMAGDWDDILALEHKATLATFDMLLTTGDTDTMKRTLLIKKLSYALEKHAHMEEAVVYPALRLANETVDADHLEHEHGYVKTFLYELDNMAKDSPNFLARVREFRELIAQHAKMEEEQVFPRFKTAIGEEQNAKITSLMNKEGVKMN